MIKKVRQTTNVASKRNLNGATAVSSTRHNNNHLHLKTVVMDLVQNGCGIHACIAHAVREISNKYIILKWSQSCSICWQPKKMNSDLLRRNVSAPQASKDPTGEIQPTLPVQNKTNYCVQKELNYCD